MNNELTSGTLWNKAAVSGLILAAVTIAFTLVSSLAGKIDGAASGILSFVLWAGKVASCILLLRYFLVKLHNEYPDSDRKQLNGYGTRIAFLSAIVVAGYSLASMLLIEPEAFNEAMNVAMEQYKSMLDSNSLAAIEQMMPKLPAITFFSMLVYCFLWGWILSGIFSSSLAPSDPFANFPGNNTTENQ